MEIRAAETGLRRRLRFNVDSQKRYGVQGEAFEQRCREYLQYALDAGQPEDVLKATKRALSNPMDLTVVAQIIAEDQQPNLFHLQQQQYEVMARDFQRTQVGNEFPLSSAAILVPAGKVARQSTFAESFCGWCGQLIF